MHNASTRTFRYPALHRLRHRPPALLAAPIRRLRSWRLGKLKKRLWWREQPKPKVSAETRAELTAHFADDVALLGRLIDADLSA
ncbi:MAG: hypothetical protein M3R66_17290 [Actinomycetota bacterium]|nr:hypothetical protein [Actinomycetota bacterium]